MPRRYLIVLFAVILAAVGALAIATQFRPEPASSPAPIKIKHFTLVDQDGQTVDETAFRGQWLLLFFGFTRCPDVCPTSMIYASDLLKSLGPLADTLKIVFVSVDPERDTPTILKDYLTNFDPRIGGLTGTPEQIATVTKAFGVYYAKRKLDGMDDYTMDHSTAFYLVGPEGGFRRAFSLQRGADQMTADIRDAITPKE